MAGWPTFTNFMTSPPTTDKFRAVFNNQPLEHIVIVQAFLHV